MDSCFYHQRKRAGKRANPGVKATRVVRSANMKELVVRYPVSLVVVALLVTGWVVLTGGPVSAQTGKLIAGSGGTYSTIQAAINALPNPGPCTVTVKAGTYSESVDIVGENTLASSEAQRIVIIADPNQPPGSVTVNP